MGNEILIQMERGSQIQILIEIKQELNYKYTRIGHQSVRRQ